MHAAWKGLVEMPEQPDIVAVITTQLGLIVAEALAAREMLLEVREAAIERMAAHIDDPGVRQDEMDKADMRPVLGHLVDDERPIGFTLDARAFPIFFAPRRKLVCGSVAEALRIHGLFALQLASPPQPLPRGYEGPFPRPLA